MPTNKEYREVLEKLKKAAEERLGGLHVLHGTERKCECYYCEAISEAESLLSQPEEREIEPPNPPKDYGGIVNELGIPVEKEPEELHQPEPTGDDYLDFLFDGPPGPEAGRFIEVENPQGKSVNAGEWLQRDGYWVLRVRRDGQRQAAPMTNEEALTEVKRRWPEGECWYDSRQGIQFPFNVAYPKRKDGKFEGNWIVFGSTSWESAFEAADRAAEKGKE